MKKNKKSIIILGTIIICLLTYIIWQTVVIFKDTIKTNHEKTATSTTIGAPEEAKPKILGSNVTIGQEVTVKVGNKLKLPFYLISEEENTYSLIAKNTLGKSPYYQYDDCNKDNSSGCEMKQTELNVQTYLNEKTKDWTNVGEIRIPNNEDIAQAEVLPKVSFWISNDDSNKENLEIPYYDKESLKLENDYLYNLHDVVPIIKIMKSYVVKK